MTWLQVTADCAGAAVGFALGVFTGARITATRRRRARRRAQPSTSWPPPVVLGHSWSADWPVSTAALQPREAERMLREDEAFVPQPQAGEHE